METTSLGFRAYNGVQGLGLSPGCCAGTFPARPPPPLHVEGLFEGIWQSCKAQKLTASPSGDSGIPIQLSHNPNSLEVVVQGGR